MSAALRFHLYLEELVLAGELEPDVLLDDVDKGEGEDEVRTTLLGFTMRLDQRRSTR